MRAAQSAQQAFFDKHYLPHIKQRKRSQSTDVSIFNNHILPRWGKLLMPDITRIMVSRAHNELLEKEFKPASANKSPIYLRSAFNLAIKWNIPALICISILKSFTYT